jgi:threonine synthase
MMGLPIARLVCATNENDVLDEFFRTGVYRVRSASETRQTSSPSMDISKASNFERFIFDLLGRDPKRTRRLWDELEEKGGFDLSATPEFRGLAERFGFVSAASTHAARIASIRQTLAETGVLVDPHTADGLYAARRFQRAGEPMIVLETALPAKFAATIEEAIGRAPERPPALADLETLPQRYVVLPAYAKAIKEYIARQTGIA